MLCPTCKTQVPEAAVKCPACGTHSPVGTDPDIDSQETLVTGPDDRTLALDAKVAGPAPTGEGWSRPLTNPMLPGTAPLAPGMVLGGRYEILALVGEGGMGAVLRARDREVDRLVALKVIRSELANNPDILRRFRQELILARQVTHRNVVRIYDLGVADGLRFISMEYIEGRELTHLLEERGKLEPRETAEIMLQACSGLAAAHAEGVVHRDLKPANIMIDQQGRVSVMDFGIAYSAASMGLIPASSADRVDAPLHLTRVGALLGTPRYMSPEQTSGGIVDQRSDIFTIGLIFYELLTGDVPTKANNLTELLSERSSEPLTPLRELAPDIPEGLGRIVDRCTKLDPAERYQSAGDLVRDLEVWLGIRAAEPEKPGIARRALLGVAVLAVIAAGVAGYRVLNPPATGPHPAVKVILTDFTNNTGNPVFNGTLESMFSTALEDASFITVYNRGQARKVAETLTKSPTLNEATARLVAGREGIGVIVSGSIKRDGGGYDVTARALDSGNGKVITQESDGAPNEQAIPKVVGRLAAGIRNALGDSTPKGAQVAAAETFSSKSLEASQQYALAQELQWKGQWNEALAAYSRSIELDPDFGRAYAGLAATLANLGRRQDAETMYKLAMSKIDRMSAREKYRTRGGYYLLERAFDKATEQYRALVNQYPSDSAGIANLALAYFYQRNMPAALEQGRRAVELYPNNLLQLNNVGWFAMYAGEFDVAIQESQNLLKMNPSFEKAYICMALSQIGKGVPDKAAATYKQLAALSQPAATQAAYGLADLALYQGRLADAIGEWQKALEPDLASKEKGPSAPKWVSLGEAWLESGNRAMAMRAADQAVENGSDENVLYPAALIYIKCGKEKKALALADQLEKRFEQDPQAYGKLIRGEVQYAHGDYRDAVRTFQAAKEIADTWIGRMSLGRAYLGAGAFTEADTEFDVCMKRRGEAAAVFLDDQPSFHYFPPVLYYTGLARKGLGTEGATDWFKNFLALRSPSATDPLTRDARKQVGH